MLANCVGTAPHECLGTVVVDWDVIFSLKIINSRKVIWPPAFCGGSSHQIVDLSRRFDFFYGFYSLGRVPRHKDVSADFFELRSTISQRCQRGPDGEI